MSIIDKRTAQQRYDTGHPVRLATDSGYVPDGWTSAALGTYGLRSLSEYEKWVREVVDRLEPAPTLHWEAPPPSRRTHDEAAGFIFRHEEFEVGNTSGSSHPLGFIEKGDLPRGYWETLSGALYIVRSYRTPIAWRTVDHEVIIPPVRYSNTTTQHQYLAARAWGQEFVATDGSVRKGRGRSPYGPREGGW